MKNETKEMKEIASKLQRVEQKLSVSEGKYRQLVQHVDCIILRIESNGTITFFNEFAQSLYGYAPQEILGKTIFGTLFPSRSISGRKFAKLIRDIKRRPRQYTTCETETVCKDGRLVWVVWAIKAIRDEQRKRTEILCVGHNITERKNIENELRLLATVVRNSNDAIAVWDLEGNILSWNLGAERIYGFSQAETVKMNIRRLIPGHKQEEMQSLIEKVLCEGTIELFETQRLTKNNRILDISLTATLLKNDKGKPFAITTTERDMTERRRLEKEILDITEREREMIGQEMHDGMGQILTGIAVKGKGLALKLKGKSSEGRKDALAISKLANQAIAQTRDLAKMLYPVDIETGGLMSALKILASTIEKTFGIECRFRCDPLVSVKNLVEAKQLYRIVQEAVTNAIRHGKAKHIRIALSLTKNKTILTVKSDGRNFPKLPSSRNGFGLKIMKYRADLIGGTLEIRKGSKGGTLVICTFPEGRGDF